MASVRFCHNSEKFNWFIQDMLSFPIFPFRVSGFTFNCGCFLRFCFFTPRILCCRLDVTSGFLWISAKQIWTLFYFLELWQLNLICAILCGRFSYWNLAYTVTSWVFNLLVINGCWFNLHVSFYLISRNSHYLKLIGLLVGCSISLLTFYFSKFLSTDVFLCQLFLFIGFLFLFIEIPGLIWNPLLLWASDFLLFRCFFFCYRMLFWCGKLCSSGFQFSHIKLFVGLTLSLYLSFGITYLQLIAW